MYKVELIEENAILTSKEIKDYESTFSYLETIIKGVPSGKRGITTLRIFLTIDAPFIFNVFRPFFIQKFSQVI